jgi:hypothetical protein
MNGFKCAFRTGQKPFFYCNVSQDGMRTISKVGVCHLRTMDKYGKQCMAIAFADGPEKERLQRKYGIISLSPLSNVRGFDLFNQTGIDIMHILLEGNS